MSAAAIPRLSVEEYFALDDDAELSSEYVDGVLFPLSASSIAHASLAARLGWRLEERLEERLENGPCMTLISGVRVRINHATYLYPDIFVVCGKPIVTEEHADTVTNPKTIVEILSPATQDYEYGTKFELYRQLSSLEEYVLVSQDQQRIEVFCRMTNQEWRLLRYEGAETILPLESLNISIPLREIYKGIVDDAPVVET